jgi:hypothetical protein
MVHLYDRTFQCGNTTANIATKILYTIISLDLHVVFLIVYIGEKVAPPILIQLLAQSNHSLIQLMDNIIQEAQKAKKNNI